MKVIIIEDESLSAIRLNALLSVLSSAFRIVQVLDSIEKSVESFQSSGMPDIVLMDLRLSDGICFEIFRQLTTITAPIISIPTYKRFAPRGSNVSNLNYLVKPEDIAFFKYPSATEEKRIFMFIDLNNSTSVA